MGMSARVATGHRASVAGESHTDLESDDEDDGPLFGVRVVVGTLRVSVL